MFHILSFAVVCWPNLQTINNNNNNNKANARTLTRNILSSFAIIFVIHCNAGRNAPFLMNMLFQCGIVSDYPSVLEPGGRDDVVVMDFLATQQGPNYALAKLLQKWRALWSRNSTTLLFGKGKKSKQLVSMTLGPAARTESVMHSKTMALIMNTMHHVRPNVAHAPETVQSMMT